MERRSFLKKGVFGGALLLLGGTGLALLPTRRFASPPRPLKVVDDRGFQVLVAVAGRVVSLAGADRAAIASAADEALSYVAPETQRDVKQLLGLFESAAAGLLFDARPTPFTQLDDAAQDRALVDWRDSWIAVRRSGYSALRKLCLGAAYADAGAWADTGYPGPWPTGGLVHDDSMDGVPEGTTP